MLHCLSATRNDLLHIILYLIYVAEMRLKGGGGKSDRKVGAMSSTHQHNVSLTLILLGGIWNPPHQYQDHIREETGKLVNVVCE